DTRTVTTGKRCITPRYGATECGPSVESPTCARRSTARLPPSPSLATAPRTCLTHSPSRRPTGRRKASRGRIMSFLDGLAPAHVFTCASLAVYIYSVLRGMAEARREANHRAHKLGHLRYSPSHANGKRHKVSQDALLAAEDGPVNRQAEAWGVPETAGGILLKAPAPAPRQQPPVLAVAGPETPRLPGAPR